MKTYSTGTTVVVVGPRRGMKLEQTRRGVQTRDPVRYAHLVEGGHAIVVPMEIDDKVGPTFERCVRLLKWGPDA